MYQLFSLDRGKMYTLKLYSIDLLLCLCSSPLYINEGEQPNLFLQYLYLRGDCESEVQSTSIKGGSSAHAPTHLAVGLVRALLENALTASSSSEMSAVTAAVSPGSAEAFVESFHRHFNLLLVASEEPSYSMLKGNPLSYPSPQ